MTEKKRVVILGMGSSRNDWVAARLVNETAAQLADVEVWAINSIGAVVHCDRIIHMDPLDDEGCKCGYTEWHRQQFIHTCVPIYTCKRYETFPTSVEYPLEDVKKTFRGLEYFNTSVAYAIALAIHEGAKEILLFGCDFTYADSHVAESGRACAEFWLGVAVAKGIQVTLAQNTTLMDHCDSRPLYGYSRLTKETAT